MLLLFYDYVVTILNAFLTLMIGTGERLIPRTSDRLVTDFTSNERRALYDYVIAHTEKPDIGQDIADINNL
jgi:hypothetical protein